MRTNQPIPEAQRISIKCPDCKSKNYLEFQSGKFICTDCGQKFSKAYSYDFREHEWYPVGVTLFE